MKSLQFRPGPGVDEADDPQQADDAEDAERVKAIPELQRDGPR